MIENVHLKSKKDINPKDITELIIVKQRNGPLGLIDLEFDSKYAKFLNLSTD